VIGPTQSNSNPLVEFANVSKWYGPVVALNDVTLQLQPAITGLVGPNGAGKSTLFKLLTGQLRPSLGAVRVHGIDAWSARAKSHIGYCPDIDAFYEEMSGRAFVRTMAMWHGFGRQAAAKRTEEVIEQVGMSDRAGRPLGSYSKGMRQRIKLAQAMVHDPDLIVLDEPMNGVDPVGRDDLVTLFRQLAASGKTVLVSSHVLDEMDTLADQILFICRGRILASGSLRQIRELLDNHPLQVRITSDRTRELAATVLGLDSVEGAQLSDSDNLVLQVRRPADFFKSFGDLVVKNHFEVRRLDVLDASTEAVFDYLMKEARQL
jgi:ABC-2 type transport system ATP-binding protein